MVIPPLSVVGDNCNDHYGKMCQVWLDLELDSATSVAPLQLHIGMRTVSVQSR